MSNALLSGANLQGANFKNAGLDGVDWSQAIFDNNTKFPAGFEIPHGLVWAGTNADPRKNVQGKKKTKKSKTGQSKRRPSAQLSAKSLLSNAKLAKYCKGIEADPNLPEGASVELLDHPVFGADLGYCFCLEFSCERLADLELTQTELDFNMWYRSERFARLYDATEGGYCEGNHDVAQRLLEHTVIPNIDEEEMMSVYNRVENEVSDILSRVE